MNPVWIAVIYAFTSIVTLMVTISTDKFFIFSDFYVRATIILPTFLIPGLIIYWRVRHTKWHWLIVLTGCLMVVGVSFVHIWFVAQASASV